MFGVLLDLPALGRFVWVLGAFRPWETVVSVPFQATSSPFGGPAAPSGRLDRRSDGPRSNSLRWDWFGLDQGMHRLPPRTGLRREAWILKCVAATDGDPAQHGVRRQDVVVSTSRFGCRSGESSGPTRIGTFSCSWRKGRRFAGPPSGVAGLESRGVSCQFFTIPRMKRPSSISPTAIAASAGIRFGRVAPGSRDGTFGTSTADRNDKCQDQDGFMLPRVDGDSV